MGEQPFLERHLMPVENYLVSGIERRGYEELEANATRIKSMPIKSAFTSPS